MKILEKFNVTELKSNESTLTNGGFWKEAAAVLFWHWDNWDDIKEGFESA